MMKRINTAKKNYIYQASYDLLLLILPFITSPYISRTIGAEGIGTFAYHYTIAYYFTLISDLGIKYYGNREIAQCRDDRRVRSEVFSNVEVVHVVFSVTCTLMYLIYVFFAVEASERIFAFVMVAQVASSIFDISWFFFGLERFRLSVVVNTIIKGLSVVSIFAFVRRREDLWIYCLIISLGALIGQIIMWIPLLQFVSFEKPNLFKMRAHVKPMLILFIPTIAVSIYKYMDKIMIGIMSDKVQLGLYENADKAVAFPLTLVFSFGTVMIPKMSFLFSNNKYDRIQSIQDLSMKYVMGLAYALAFGLAAIAKVFSVVFWGAEFESSGYIIMGLATTIPFVAFGNIIKTQILLPQKKDGSYVAATIGGAITNVLINIVLIPLLGAFGATMGTIIAEITACGILCWGARRDVPLFKHIRESSIFALLGSLMFVAVYTIGRALPMRALTLCIQVTVGFLIYCFGSAIYLYSIKEKTFMVMLKKLKERCFAWI